ncbi:type II toxin-antitoxin system RelE/ParE family toxin [Candidatus Woesearchaeota archaeon]|nr:type II toxin-antitoxin system RelE/ParE family toxin [Candidatus Woesearchaeota archaeon]
MTSWQVITTVTFEKQLKKLRKISQLLDELDKKMKRLEDNPFPVGKILHGNLHPSRSTRLYGKYRLIFQIDEKNRKVYLEFIDHREDVYEV